MLLRYPTWFVFNPTFPGAGKLFDCGKKFFLTFSEIILEGKIQKNPPQKIFPAATAAAASAAPKKTENL